MGAVMFGVSPVVQPALAQDGYDDDGGSGDGQGNPICGGINTEGFPLKVVLTTTEIYYDPSFDALIPGLTVNQDQTFFEIETAVDEDGNIWSKIVIACITVWVPGTTLGEIAPAPVVPEPVATAEATAEPTAE
jgi:hypothetical protein